MNLYNHQIPSPIEIYLGTHVKNAGDQLYPMSKGSAGGNLPRRRELAVVEYHIA
jgi:hypothetical protein